MAGLGLVILFVLLMPILTGIVAGVFLWFVPRFRFVALYSALVPLFGVLGLVGGVAGGFRLARPYFYRYEYGLSATEWPGWAITVIVALLGVALGVTAGIFSARGVNRVACRFLHQ